MSLIKTCFGDWKFWPFTDLVYIELVSTNTPAKPQNVSVFSAIAIGVGGMMGAGLFTLLGLAATTAGPWIPLAFLVAGVAASFSVYSYSKLGATYPSGGGAATFVIKQFGHSSTSATINIFQYVGYLIATALYASGLSEYVGALIGENSPAWLPSVIGPAIVVLFVLVNIFGSKLAGRAETYLVGLGLAILLAFLIFGSTRINPSIFLASDHNGSLLGIVIAAGLLYNTYQGFGVVTNLSAEMSNPKKQIPQAMFAALAVVTLVYLAVSTVAVLLVSDSSLVKDAGHVLADAGTQLLGKVGFVAISVAAILAMASAVNATVLASAKIGDYLAGKQQLPAILSRTFGGRVSASLLISGAMIVVLVLVFPLSAVGQMTSLAFLLVYAAVSFGHLRVRQATGAKAWLLITAIVVNLIMFALLMFHAVTTGPAATWVALLVAVVGSWLIGVFISRKKDAHSPATPHTQ